MPMVLHTIDKTKEKRDRQFRCQLQIAVNVSGQNGWRWVWRGEGWDEMTAMPALLIYL